MQLPDNELHWPRFKRKVVTAWLVIAIAPVVPLLAVLIVLKLWERAWPIIITLVVVLLLVGGYRLVRAWWWRQ